MQSVAEEELDEQSMLFTGAVFGAVDMLPMIRMKLDGFSCASAFVFFLVAPFIVYNTELFSMPWWLKCWAR